MSYLLGPWFNKALNRLSKQHCVLWGFLTRPWQTLMGLGPEPVSSLGLEGFWEGGLMFPPSFSLETLGLLDDAPIMTGFSLPLFLIWLLRHFWAQHF